MGILSGVAFANLGISGVAEAFQLIPSGLSPGNQYRVVFVTDGTIQATSTDINTYNTFVDNEAHTSTILNDAFTNVGIDPASIGSSYGTNVTWISYGSDFGPGFNGPVAFRPLYGISSVLTVPTPTATTPEPSSLLGFITLGGLMLGSVACKARK